MRSWNERVVAACEDRILIDELKARGYIIPKKGHTKTVHVRSVHEPFEFERMQATPAWMDSTKYILAAKLGRTIHGAGALRWTEEGPVNSGLDAGLCVLQADAYVVVADPATTTLEPADAQLVNA
jgi:hypothetical protein